MLCKPKSALKCWEYVRHGAVPLWVLPYLSATDELNIAFNYPENGGQVSMNWGDWVIELTDGVVEHFTAAAFRSSFELLPEESRAN